VCVFCWWVERSQCEGTCPHTEWDGGFVRQTTRSAVIVEVVWGRGGLAIDIHIPCNPSYCTSSSCDPEILHDIHMLYAIHRIYVFHSCNFILSPLNVIHKVPLHRVVLVHTFISGNIGNVPHILKISSR
jgi:hypothetical protein